MHAPQVVAIIAAALFCALIGVTALWLRERKRIAETPHSTEPERYPFRQRRPLSETQQALYWRLRKALPGQIVLAQVALPRLIEVAAGNEHRSWMRGINRLTVDFVVCLKDSSVIAAIELEDGHARKPEESLADRKREKALASADIKLLRYTQLPSEEEIRQVFLG